MGAERARRGGVPDRRLSAALPAGYGGPALDRASALRLGELQNESDIIRRHPWFGAGWAAEGQSIELEFTLGVSNIYLTVAERSGLIALVAYLAALAALAQIVWRALRKPL